MGCEDTTYTANTFTVYLQSLLPLNLPMSELSSPLEYSITLHQLHAPAREGQDLTQLPTEQAKERALVLGQVRMEQFTGSTEFPSTEQILAEFKTRGYDLVWVDKDAKLTTQEKILLGIDPNQEVPAVMAVNRLMLAADPTQPPLVNKEVRVFQGMRYDDLYHEYKHVHQLELISQPRDIQVDDQLITFHYTHLLAIQASESGEQTPVSTHPEVLPPAYQTFLEYHNTLLDFKRLVMRIIDDPAEYKLLEECVYAVVGETKTHGFLELNGTFIKQVKGNPLIWSWIRTYFEQPTQYVGETFAELENFCFEFIENDTTLKPLPEVLRIRQHLTGK
jgi:hypothetical protein